jgi:site-specific DNA-methyltransferase (adenine-specific)
LIEPCILAGSRPGDVVLDPFGGAGTTALVALQHGRDSVYIELNPEYAVLARDRLTTALGAA